MTLRERLADPSPDVRIAAYRSLLGARSLHALRLLTEGLDDPHDGVVTAAAEVLMETTDLGPRTIVAFHPRRAARRVAVRMTDDVDLLYLLLADPETRDEAIERVRQSPPIGRSPQRAAILRRLLADGSLPPPAVARLFADDPDSLAWLVMQLVRGAIDASAETVDDRPVQFAQLNAPVPAPFVTLIELLDAVPAAWLRTLAHREVLREEEGPRTAFLAWLSLTAYAARHHAAHASWTPESLAVESSMMPWLLLDASLPLALRRDALRAAAGLTGELVDRNAFAWDAQFVLGCLFDPVGHRASGVHDLRAAYALLDVRSVGIPLKKMHERLGIHAIVRAAPEGASDLAWMIGKTLVRRTEHEVGEEWLTAIANAEPRAFVDITRTLPSSWWIDVVHRLDPPKLDALLTALADSDAPAATWSTWAAALTHSRPTAGAMLEQHGYRIVRAGTPAFPHAISDAQKKAADKLGAPPIIQHLATGIVFVLIPGGDFVMGAPDSDRDAYEREKPACMMVLEPFYLAVSPVTQTQWRGPELPFRDGAHVPVRGVSWTQASAFARSQKMRLPTEKEWERAARAGTTTRYWWGDAYQRHRANCQEEFSPARPSQLGEFPASPWGLLDILGNVWEWCQEWFTDPMFRSSPARWRVLRGGSWYSERWNLRCSERFWGDPDGTDSAGVCGVRPVVDVNICFEGPASA